VKQDQVPQDAEDKAKVQLHKLYYATDGSDHYTRVNSVGWEPESEVLRLAWEDARERAEEARALVIAGKASPVLYYMEKYLMTPQILAGYVHTLPFMVSLHTKPFIFGLLSDKTKANYAFAFRIPIADLTDIEKIKTDVLEDRVDRKR
jgi:hypothetical protein